MDKKLGTSIKFVTILIWAHLAGSAVSSNAQDLYIHTDPLYNAEVVTIQGESGKEVDFSFSNNVTVINSTEFMPIERVIENLTLIPKKGTSTDSVQLQITIRRCGSKLCKSKIFVSFIDQNTNRFEERPVTRICTSDKSTELDLVRRYVICKAAYSHYTKRHPTWLPTRFTAALGWFNSSILLANLKEDYSTHFTYRRDSEIEGNIKSIIEETAEDKFVNPKTIDKLIQVADRATLFKWGFATKQAQAKNYNLALILAYEVQAALNSLIIQNPRDSELRTNLRSVNVHIDAWTNHATVTETD